MEAHKPANLVYIAEKQQRYADLSKMEGKVNI